MKIAIVGATGMVGRVMLDALAGRNFPVTEVLPVASEKSQGKEIEFWGEKHLVLSPEQALERKPEIALFSAGASASKQLAPAFAEKGCFVIDNSSAWRMDKGKKLIVPEINASELTADDKIIANPNCSTIQLVMVLAPLHKAFGIRRVVVSTYQSVTGSGVKAVLQLENERNTVLCQKYYPHQIDLNCLPHCDDFLENAYTKEEMKLVNESRKILKDDELKLTATAVRVPVLGGHCESVNVELKRDFDLNEIFSLLENTQGVVLQDDPPKNIYPMPVLSARQHEVFVGRIRRDFSQPNTLNLWIVADNLRKGAATNAVQIAEVLLKNQWVGKKS